VRHSEANPSKTDAAHLLQIWILPERRGIEPGYEQKEFPAEEKRGKLRLIASPDGKDKSVTIHQDAKLYVSLLKPGEHVQHELPNDRYGWLQVAKGTVELNGKPLQQGDGAATFMISFASVRAGSSSVCWMLPAALTRRAALFLRPNRSSALCPPSFSQSRRLMRRKR